MTAQEFIKEAARRLRILRDRHKPLSDQRINELALKMTRTGSILDLQYHEMQALVMEVYDRRAAVGFAKRIGDYLTRSGEYQGIP